MSNFFGLFKISLEAQFEDGLNHLFTLEPKTHHSSIYKALNLELKPLHRFNELHDFLNKLISQQILPNVFILNQLILKLFKIKQAHLALKTFELMTSCKLQNSISYNTMIAQLAHIGLNHLALIFSLFSEAKDLQLTDTVTYNSMIHAMGKFHQFDRALAFFSEAKAIGACNLVTFSSILYVLSKQKPVSVALALQIFEEAKLYCVQKDSVLYANILLCIANSQSPNPVLCQEIFTQAQQEGLLNPYIISNTLFALSRSKSPSITDALEIFNAAKKNHMIDAMAYANTLTVIAKSNLPKAALALDLLTEAIANHHIDTVVFACALDVFVHADDGLLCDAKAIFQDAKNKAMVNHVTYASYLQFLAKLSPPPITHILDTYHEAILLPKVDSHIYSTTLYALAKAKDSPVDVAEKIFKQAIEKAALDSVIIANLLMVYQNQSQHYSAEAKIIFELAKSEQLLNPVIISILLKILTPSDPFLQILSDYCIKTAVMDEQLANEFKALGTLTQKQLAISPSFFYSTQYEANTPYSSGMVLNGDKT